MDVIESAFSDGADANTKLEAELASDRNAAVSVIYPEQAKIGRMLSTPEGAPSPLFRGLQLLVGRVLRRLAFGISRVRGWLRLRG